MPNYAFTGHPAIGAHVARCLEPLGWKPAADVSKAKVVFTYFTVSSDLEDAYFDEGGIVKRAKPGTLLIDLSPSAPSLARELAAVAAVNELRFVEAPLCVVDPTLPDAFEDKGNVFCFAAGERDDVEEAVDLLETIAGFVQQTGTGGSAQLAKAAYTAQFAAEVASAVESDALIRATRALSSSIDALDVGAFPKSPTLLSMTEAIVADSFEGTYTVEMFMAEVTAAMMAADDVELILPQLESVMHLLEVLMVIGGAGLSPMALSLMYRDEAASAGYGLDWSRAEKLFGGCDYDDEDACGCDHRHYDHGYDDDEGDFSFGGISGYSTN